MSDDHPQTRRIKREQRATHRSQMELLHHFMSTPLGRSYMYGLLADCGVYDSGFATNALSMAFLSGRRDIGLRIMAHLVEASPDNYLTMLKEQGNVRPGPEPQPARALTDSEPEPNGADEPAAG